MLSALRVGTSSCWRQANDGLAMQRSCRNESTWQLTTPGRSGSLHACQSRQCNLRMLVLIELNSVSLAVCEPAKLEWLPSSAFCRFQTPLEGPPSDRTRAVQRKKPTVSERHHGSFSGAVCGPTAVLKLRSGLLLMSSSICTALGKPRMNLHSAPSARKLECLLI